MFLTRSVRQITIFVACSTRQFVQASPELSFFLLGNKNEIVEHVHHRNCLPPHTNRPQALAGEVETLAFAAAAREDDLRRELPPLPFLPQPEGRRRQEENGGA